MTSPLTAPEDGEMPVMYTRRRLIADGFVRSNGDLWRKMRQQGFPQPIKADPENPASGSEWHGPSVRAWHRARLEKIRQTGSPMT